MKGRIPRSFIEDLLDRVDIIDVISPRVSLKKSGANYMACCPFHNEKTPSFSVNQNKQFYHCFGCGVSGDAIRFLTEYERLDFVDAVEQLANQAGLEVPRETLSPMEAKREERKRTLYDLMQDAARLYYKALRKESRVQNYVVKRGLTPATARSYGLGYAPAQWDFILNELDSMGYEQTQMIEAGLIIENEESNRRYDRFRNRLMFPIRDSRGRFIGFGGRVLDDSKPKYLNSPETPIFHKGKELYGLHEIKQSKNSIDRLLVVEGYMDVVALRQFDVDFAVATLGTAATIDHIRLAFKHTSELVFCFDGDEAGRRAAKRALANALEAMEDGRSVKFLFLAEGEDPDSLVQKIGSEAFLRMVKHAVPLEEQLFASASEDLDLSSLDARATVAKRLAPMIATIPDGIFKELIHEKLAEVTGLNRQTIDRVYRESPADEPAHATDHDDELASYLADAYGDTNHSQESTRTRLSDNQLATLRAVEKLTGCIIRQPSLIVELPPLTDLPESDHSKTLTNLVELLSQKPDLTSAKLYGLWLAKFDREAADKLFNSESLVAAIPDSGLANEALGLVKFIARSIDKSKKKQRISELKQKSLSELSSEERNELKELLLSAHNT